MRIKIVSLWQPWAWAMWNGLKLWETRDTWVPVVMQLARWKGPVGIHAAKKHFRGQDYSHEFNQSLQSYGVPNLSAGDYGVLGGICPARGEMQPCMKIAPQLSQQELFFGNYSYGRTAIHLPGIVKLPKPIPMVGHQGLWDWDAPPEIAAFMLGEQIDRSAVHW